MGKRGPKKTPTKILKMRDSWLAKTRPNEPVVANGRPRCPIWLSKKAKTVWRSIVPQLEKIGVLASVDGNALIRYCETFAQWQIAAEWIDSNGQVYTEKDKEGKPIEVKAWPQIGIYHKLSQTLGRLEQSFGLTPSARAGIEIIQPQEDNKDNTRFFRNRNTG